jgi:hypothetical protein
MEDLERPTLAVALDDVGSRELQVRAHKHVVFVPTLKNV